MKSNLIKLFLFGCLLMPLGAKAAGPVQYFCIELHERFDSKRKHNCGFIGHRSLSFQ